MMFMLSFVREKHGLHHVLEKNSNKDINPFQKGSNHRASDHISPRNFFLLWTTLFEIWLLQKVFVPWCWVWVFFIHSWVDFMHSDFPGQGVPVQSRSSHIGSSRRSERHQGKAASSDEPSIPGAFWVRHTCTAVLWQVHKLVQRQIPVPSQLPELKPQTGSTSRTRICSRFKQMQDGRCTMEFRSGRRERSTAQSHGL